MQQWCDGVACSITSYPSLKINSLVADTGRSVADWIMYSWMGTEIFKRGLSLCAHTRIADHFKIGKKSRQNTQWALSVYVNWPMCGVSFTHSMRLNLEYMKRNLNSNYCCGEEEEALRFVGYTFAVNFNPSVPCAVVGLHVLHIEHVLVHTRANHCDVF